MDTTDPSPPPASKVPPESLALRAPQRPVMRLNRRTLIVSASALALGVAVASMWALQSKTHRGSGHSEPYNVDHVAKAEDLERLPANYAELPQPPASAPASTSAPPVLGPPLPGELGGPVLQASRGMASSGGGSPSAEALDRQRDAEQAARSSVFFQISNAGQADTAAAGAVPAASAMPSHSGSPYGGSSPASLTAAQPSDPTAIQNRQGEKEAFLANPGDTATRNAGALQAPASPYTVMAGTVIPAALVTGINSDLPGQVIATVTQSVYDTATGRYLLIPQGSRLIGRYDSQVAFGQQRVLLVWLRLILPDTSSIALDKLPGIDPAGYAGLEDGVNWHWSRILAGAALSTLLGVSSELAVSNEGDVNGDVVLALRDSAQDTTNQVGQEITRRNLSVQPTLTIRPGFPMDVMVDKDLVLRPYQPLFVQGDSLP
ncbi:MAG: TrbI/VirB10 family protein [Acetobacteraceae bacterium]